MANCGVKECGLSVSVFQYVRLKNAERDKNGRRIIDKGPHVFAHLSHTPDEIEAACKNTINTPARILWHAPSSYWIDKLGKSIRGSQVVMMYSTYRYGEGLQSIDVKTGESISEALRASRWPIGVAV